MADKNPEANLSKIVLLMRVAFGKGSAANERKTAIDRINDCLNGDDGLDIHDLTARIENSSALTKSEVKKIYDKGRADEAEEQKRRAVTVPPAPKPFFSSGYTGSSFGSSSVSNTAPSYVGANDGGPGGYSWGDIANYCAAHVNRIPEKHREFVGDMADDLNHGGRMSGKQAKYLGNLFNQYLGGRIK